MKNMLIFIFLAKTEECCQDENEATRLHSLLARS